MTDELLARRARFLVREIERWNGPDSFAAWYVKDVLLGAHDGDVEYSEKVAAREGGVCRGCGEALSDPMWVCANEHCRGPTCGRCGAEHCVCAPRG